jgi:hypothetical protein
VPTAAGGVLALTSNIGRHYRSVFSVVPEADVTVGWRVTDWLTASVGYTFTGATWRARASSSTAT